MPGKMARSDPRPSVRVTRGAGSGEHHLENLGINEPVLIAVVMMYFSVSVPLHTKLRPHGPPKISFCAAQAGIRDARRCLRETAEDH